MTRNMNSNTVGNTHQSAYEASAYVYCPCLISELNKITCFSFKFCKENQFRILTCILFCFYVALSFYAFPLKHVDQGDAWPELVYWAHYQRNTPYGVKWLRAKAQSRLYLIINILFSEKHISNISPVKVRAQKTPKQKYIY